MLSRASHVSPAFRSAQDDKDHGRRPIRRRARVLGASLALCAALSLAGSISLLAALPAGAESLPARCDKVAAPTGSDSASGSAATPVRSVGALANALAPGQVGCLRAGVYGGGLRVNHGGVPGAPIGLRSYPGEHATITGRIYVPAGSNYVSFEGLSLDGNYQSGERLPSPTVNANHVTFESDDVTNDHTGICFDIGSVAWGFADSTVIAHDRIHDCGALPSTNQQHGIYVQDATNTQIVGNVIVNNVDRGIQLYPNSTGAVITGNVIANNGEGVIFSGEGASSNGNLVEHNLIVNSKIRRDVESWYPSGTPRGVGNLVRDQLRVHSRDRHELGWLQRAGQRDRLAERTGRDRRRLLLGRAGLGLRRRSRRRRRGRRSRSARAGGKRRRGRGRGGSTPSGTGGPRRRRHARGARRGLDPGPGHA